MTGLQPVAAVFGQLESIGDRRTEINFLNLGTFDIVSAASTITISKTFTFVSAPSGPRVNINNINGGQLGDVLLVFGDNIRMRSTGNLVLSGNFNMNLFDSMILLSTGTTWIELNRKNN